MTAPAVGRRLAWYTVGVLTAAQILSWLDRQLPNLLLQSIKADLGLSDTQVSLLSGLSFALVYALAAFPLSRLSDRWSRRGVVALGVFLWGAATSVCGLATSFLQFFVARMGVGLGEAALSPAAFSLIADLFAPDRRGRALGVFIMGGALGIGLALLLGGAAVAGAEGLRLLFPTQLGLIAPWRIVLSGVGLLTLCLLVAIARIADPRLPHGDAGEKGSAVVDLRLIGRDWRAYLPALVGLPFFNAGAAGFQAWIPSLFIRQHGWTMAQTGLSVGVASVLGGMAGSLGGGIVIDALRRRSPRAPLYFGAASLAGCTALALLLAASGDPTLQLFIVAGMTLLGWPVAVLSAALVQEVAPVRARAQFSAIYLFMTMLLGFAAGPTLVAVVTDYVIGDENRLALSIAAVWLLVLCVSGPLILLNADAHGALVRRRAGEPVA